MSFQSTRDIKKTRKKKHCMWCGQTILVGSSARYESWVWEGEFNDAYFHWECVHAREAKHYNIRTFRAPCWDEDLEYGQFEHSRGRMDCQNLPPEFNDKGERILIADRHMEPHERPF